MCVVSPQEKFCHMTNTKRGKIKALVGGMFVFKIKKSLD